MFKATSTSALYSAAAIYLTVAISLLGTGLHDLVSNPPTDKLQYARRIVLVSLKWPVIVIRELSREDSLLRLHISGRL
jgi:hypothetical protein